MDLGNIDQQVELLNTVGFTLNVEERLRLKMAQTSLFSANHDLDQLKFWGRIEGLAKSYYVIVGLRYNKSYQFPHKYFYYALSSDMEFKQLPELIVQHEGLGEKFNTMPFIGDPNKILVNVEGQGEQAEGQPPEQQNPNGANPPKAEQDQDQDLKKVPKKNFTQLHRLSFLIRAIENDVQCVPKDAYKMTPQHQLHPNAYFYGLELEAAGRPSSWQHFRPPTSAEARKVMDDDMVVFSSGFLDTIESDFPRGSWSIQLDSKQKSVNLRSFLWPGYFSFHRLGTSLHGGAYIGDGIKNIDLPFMI